MAALGVAHAGHRALTYRMRSKVPRHIEERPSQRGRDRPAPIGKQGVHPSLRSSVSLEDLAKILRPVLAGVGGDGDRHDKDQPGMMTDTPLWIETDTQGMIYGIAPDTAKLLGLSQRGAYARDVRLFFPTAYRPLSALLREAEEQVVEASYPLYPRDRRPIHVHVQIARCTRASSPVGPIPLLRWTLRVQ